MRKYKEFSTIKANYKKWVLNNLKDFKKEINSKNKDQLKELYIFRQLTEKQQAKTVKEIKKILIDKEVKKANERIDIFFKQCDIIAQVEPAKNIIISVSWAKNRTWGANPTAEVWSGGTYTTGHASGCGYDKLSTAIAEALNKNNNILNLLYNTYEKELRKNKNISLRDSIGYGSGYYGIPSFDGGVGYSCFRSIFQKLGAKTNTWQEGKNWDSMTIEF